MYFPYNFFFWSLADEQQQFAVHKNTQQLCTCVCVFVWRVDVFGCGVLNNTFHVIHPELLRLNYAISESGIISYDSWRKGTILKWRVESGSRLKVEHKKLSLLNSSELWTWTGLKPYYELWHMWFHICVKHNAIYSMTMKDRKKSFSGCMCYQRLYLHICIKFNG